MNTADCLQIIQSYDLLLPTVNVHSGTAHFKIQKKPTA